MSTMVTVAGELATMRIRLHEPAFGPSSGFVEILHPEEFARGDRPRDPELLLKAIEDDAGRDARTALGAATRIDDLESSVAWRAGSLEVTVVLSVAKLVIDAGAFLAGLRELRRLVPRTVRERVAEWLGRPVAADVARLELGAGAFDASVVADPAPALPAAPVPATPAPRQPLATVGEHLVYGFSALVVLLVVSAAVIAGAKWIT